MKLKILYIIFIFPICLNLFAEIVNDKKQVKEGLNFNFLPIFGYDNDKGTEYGGIIDIFDFGTGKNYPTPNQELYLEYTAYTGGTQQYYVTYDNRSLIPGLQFTINPFYRFESNMNFYGYNGYQTNSLEMKSSNNLEKLSSFYQVQHKNYGVRIDFKKHLLKSLFWQGSYLFNYTITDEVNLKNKQITEISLLSYYKKWGIIPSSDGSGGVVSATNLSLVWDSRNANAVPISGIWAEARIELAPNCLGTKKSFYKYNLTYRQYLPIVKNRLIFAYRLDYSATIGSYHPYYRLPLRVAFGNVQDYDGIGGSKTVRGVNRDRVVGLDNLYFNSTFRYFFANFNLLKQNIGLCANTFFDGGIVTRGYDLTYRASINDKELYNKYKEIISPHKSDSFHLACGLGLKLILNDNFVVSMDYGLPLNKEDGDGGFYVCTGFLF